MVQRIGGQLAAPIALGGHGHQLGIEQITISYTVDEDDQQLWVDSSLGALTITLQDPADAENKVLFLVVVDAASTITLDPAVGNIDGAATITTAVSRIIACDGTEWRTVASA